ncbi:MAG: hypothetical protein WD512_10925 [Candidatus Paceibacterota bacterium]
MNNNINNIIISQIPICTRIYEYLNPKDKLEFRNVCKGIYKICPITKYRVVSINNLSNNNDNMILFIESNPENDPEIDKLLRVIEFMTFGLQISNKFTYIEINNHIKNPLSVVYNIDNDTTTYILSGKFTFTLEIPPESHLPKRRSRPVKVKSTNEIDRKTVRIALYKLLKSMRKPKWENICKYVYCHNEPDDYSDDNEN